MKVFEADKTGMIGLPYGEKNDNMLSRIYLIQERHDETDRIAIAISRVSVLTRDKNALDNQYHFTKKVTLKAFEIHFVSKKKLLQGYKHALPRNNFHICFLLCLNPPPPIPRKIMI